METEEPPLVEVEPRIVVLLGYLMLLVGSVEIVVRELGLVPPDPLPHVRFL
jgi:hypothetical protein